MKLSGPLARNPLFYLGLLLIAIAVLSTWVGTSYFYQRLRSGSGDALGPGNGLDSRDGNTSGTDANYVAVNTLINYGNGASDWYNETRVPVGWNFYDLTDYLADVESYYDHSLKAHDIISINGVKASLPSTWTLWIYCPEERAWAASGWGADWLQLVKGGLLIKLVYGSILIPSNTLAWYYQAIPSPDPSTWQPPVAGASNIGECW